MPSLDLPRQQRNSPVPAFGCSGQLVLLVASELRVLRGQRCSEHGALLPLILTSPGVLADP